MNRLLAPAFALCLLAPSGPAVTGGRSDAAPASQGRSTPSLRGSTVYVYSFLDVREKELGPKLVDELNRRLVDDLNLPEVRTKVLKFGDSPERSDIPAEDVERFRMFFGLYYRNMDLGRSGFAVPVTEIVSANRTAEIASGAKYRLIVFPQDVSPGFRPSYTIRWTLYDITTHQRIWSYLYSGRDSSLERSEEYWAARAKKQLDEVIGALRDGGLL